MELNNGQQQALDYIKKWIVEGDELLCTLSGNAGTGKTTLTKLIVKFARQCGKQVLCAAPTHKARKVMSHMINGSSIIQIPTTTISSLLGKVKKHSFIGSRNFKMELSDKIAMYDLIIIDEISMVSHNDYQIIAKLAHVYNKKILMLGDEAQIPNPCQSYIKKKDAQGDPYLEKATVPAFSLANKQQLSEIMRNSAQNPLLDLYDRIRQNIGTGFNIVDLSEGVSVNMVDDKGYHLTNDISVFHKLISDSLELFVAGKNKVVTYTNESVLLYNKEIRRYLGYQSKYEMGEIIMGYENIGSIENGQEYQISTLEYTEDHEICANDKQYHNLAGHYMKLVEIEKVLGIPIKIFVPDLECETNIEIINDLVDLAYKVNKKGSTKFDYKKYMILKTQLFFFDSIFNFNGLNIAENEFKKQHCLLNQPTSDYIIEEKGIKKYVEGEHVDKVRTNYPGILERRFHDSKEIVSSEKLYDMFKIINKDIDYGYAITAHKSQGSTYSNVFIPENCFNQLKDGWSKKFRCRINRKTERDQMKYVSVTRAQDCCYIYTGEQN
jgi:hypothetical protein